MKIICTNELKSVSGGSLSAIGRAVFVIIGALVPLVLGDGTRPPNERKDNGSEKKDVPQNSAGSSIF